MGAPEVRAFLTHLAVEGRDFCARLVANRLPFPRNIAVVLAGLDTTFRSQPAQIERLKLIPSIAQRGVPAVAANAAKVGRSEG
jgi:hypothetical protein